MAWHCYIRRPLMGHQAVGGEFQLTVTSLAVLELPASVLQSVVCSRSAICNLQHSSIAARGVGASKATILAPPFHVSRIRWGP